MNDFPFGPQWLVAGAAVLVVGTGGYLAHGAHQRRGRRKALLARLDRIAYASAHHVLVPDGMGGFIHVDHLLLTRRGVLVLDTRRVAGLIFGGDQMSDWTVMGRRRYTFDNPQPALYDRVAAVKALVGDLPVEGRLLFSNLGKFTKGKPKYVLMLDGVEVEFPLIDRDTGDSKEFAQYLDGWKRLIGQLRPSPHTFTNL